MIKAVVTMFREFEPFIVYFDPILTSLLSGPNRNVLLRWTNISSDETEDLRPDATISKIEQLDFGASLGFGEAKISHSTTTTDTHALCHELLRSATFSKDTIDHNSLQAALPLQIHGYLEDLKNIRTLLKDNKRILAAVDDSEPWKEKRRFILPGVYSLIGSIFLHSLSACDYV
ncbi:hypothetical protein HPULCUR_006037 [Helicostylum pulchrum]|uniref:Uncharacterized protein n=1 Tax=Helicostylum pulchrum TaxID=562976 RepID=A0ABP9Y0R6_9FUNG